MMNILYIGEEVIQIKGGADQVNKRNINLLLDSGNLLKILSSSNKKGKDKKIFVWRRSEFYKTSFRRIVSKSISYSLYKSIFTRKNCRAYQK